jgi:hypothetical protein
MIGPLIIAASLAWRHDFQLAFALLTLPAVITLSVVFAARFIYPNAGRAVRRSPTVDHGGYPLAFWWYVIAASLVRFGFADFSLLAYHFGRRGYRSSTRWRWAPAVSGRLFWASCSIGSV